MRYTEKIMGKKVHSNRCLFQLKAIIKLSYISSCEAVYIAVVISIPHCSAAVVICE